MANVSDAQLARLLDAADRVLGGIPAGRALSRPVGGSTPRLPDNGDIGAVYGVVTGIAAKVGAPVDVDEAAIAAALAPQIAEAVKAAVAGGANSTDPTALADAVVARLGERLSPSA